MNWAIPIGVTIRTFIGFLLLSQSFVQASFGAIGALVAGIVISILIRNKRMP
ncbi:hypothetical protein GCM10007063_34890 [Lentibacillus kapialis]|uniref:Uncharacterized protein n=1 Tax=Lentibacillus kapialis TaxID=340214 RepID=A0A917Q2U1_9BACI|nr:hypothetical protein [Lentibacillus kapialis]GGK09443.1 hypothetical protein GCM10007063_34890 [Lentibacillus kapialis]